MATKTISLELDAYEKLKAAKRSPRESFSQVVRRAEFPDRAYTAADLLEEARNWVGQSVVGDDELKRLEQRQNDPCVSRSHWEDEDAV